MFKPNDEQIKFAQNVVNTQPPNAAGYRLVIKPLPWSDNLKAGAAAKFETLAKANFIAQSSEQTAREARGSHVGIVCHAGVGAFDGKAFNGKKWAEEGDVVVFNRHAGMRVDFPPGSEDYYNVCNDEDILCNYGVKV